MKVNVKENKDARSKYYVNAIVGLWIPTIFILFLVGLTELRFTDIGISIPSINTETFGPWLSYVVMGIAGIFLLNYLYISIAYHFSEKVRNQLSKATERQSDKIEFIALLPVSKKEKRLWNYVSLTAGVTEEIIYRGFLIFALAYLFPNFSIWTVIIIASLLFGLAHTYQNLSGVIRTAIFGMVFSLLYVVLGSIIPLILLHFLVDYVAKFGEDKSS